MADHPPTSAPQPEETSPVPAPPPTASGSGHKRLHRSRQHRMLLGVCGGLGEYFDVDPTIIRIIFLASLLLGGTGIIVYLVLLVVMPDEQQLGSHPREAVRSTVGEVTSETRNAVSSATSWTKSKLGRD